MGCLECGYCSEKDNKISKKQIVAYMATTDIVNQLIIYLERKEERNNDIR